MTTNTKTRRYTAAQIIMYARAAIRQSVRNGAALVTVPRECIDLIAGWADESDGCTYFGGDIANDRGWQVEVRS